MVKGATFGEPLTVREVYRANRIRLAQAFHISPLDVDAWDMGTYYDALEVMAADDILQKLNR